MALTPSRIRMTERTYVQDYTFLVIEVFLHIIELNRSKLHEWMEEKLSGKIK